MIVRQVVNSIFNSCSYVLSSGHRSWIVDCGDVDKLLPLIDGELAGVMLTHGHFDHIYGLNSLISVFPSVPVYTNRQGLESLTNERLNYSKYHGDPFIIISPELVKVIDDGATFELFDGVSAKAVFTPGHSPDCVTWLVDNMLFTGDSYIPGVKTVTIFTQSDKQLAAQSEMIIHQLAENRTVYPGHAPSQNEINNIII